MTMTLTKAAGLVGSIGVLIGALFAIDTRYLHAVYAAEAEQKQEANYAQLKLEIYRERIARLNAKPQLTPDERDELEWTRELVKKLQLELLKK